MSYDLFSFATLGAAAASGAAVAIFCGDQPSSPAPAAPTPLPAATPSPPARPSSSGRDFEGKVVLVTGGAMGIGRAIVEAFAARGATVVYADLLQCLEDNVAPTAGALITAEGLASGEIAHERVYWVKCDVSDAAQVEAAVAKTRSDHGRVDVLVNNAGICPDDSCVGAHELPVDVYDKVLAVNSRSYFLFAKYVIGQCFIPQGGGVIVNLASVQGLQSVPGVPAYAASKGAVLSLTRNLAVEYATRGIRVNAINPGSIRTPMLMHFLGDEAEKTDPTPLKRWGERTASCSRLTPHVFG